MKKLISISMVVAFLFLTMCNNNSVNHGNLANKISNFETANFEKVVINSETAKDFTETFIFAGEDETNSIGFVYFNSLPKIQSTYDTRLSLIPHGVTTILENEGHSYALIPKHLFMDIHFSDLLKSSGFNFSEKNDLVSLHSKNVNQKSLDLKLLDKLNPNELDGASCIIETLNCFIGDTNLYGYKIHGILRYLSPDEQDYLSKNSTNSYGTKYDGLNTDGLYVVRVPEILSDEILGMSGGSVVVKLNGEDYFFGLNVERRRLGYLSSSQDTTYVILIGIQPVSSSDL